MLYRGKKTSCKLDGEYCSIQPLSIPALCWGKKLMCFVPCALCNFKCQLLFSYTFAFLSRVRLWGQWDPFLQIASGCPKRCKVIPKRLIISLNCHFRVQFEG
ncbi:hypothetical protein ES288_1Z010800v1 [Gossypium darwinii]|uniref:Uncharacterized protein n=1 Tax=Gossypium darwinii TaxID=34276 RepID=A0A5C7J1X4_GOSDA|nr:hypothetical protein ES288_1Z010800v1 [Gossypium darwinii]